MDVPRRSRGSLRDRSKGALQAGVLFSGVAPMVRRFNLRDIDRRKREEIAICEGSIVDLLLELSFVPEG